MWGGELVVRDGRAAGQVTSAAWGETVGGSVGLAYIRAGGGVVTADVARAGSYEVNVGGELRRASLHLRPPFDPAGEKIKGR
jgi:4-methylaminobutanoate oxidase (formaldehyde-forming)